MHCRRIRFLALAAGLMLAGCGAEEEMVADEAVARTGFYAEVDGQPPAEQAVQWAYAGHVSEMKKLVDKDASLVNVVVGEYTPLTAAVLSESGDMVDFLLERGADPNLASTQGTPLALAESANVDGDIIDALKEHGAK